MEASKGVISENCQHLLTCKLCFNRMENPGILLCLHSFCNGCLESLVGTERKSISCPVCSEEALPPVSGNSFFPVASHVLYLAEAIEINDTTTPFQCCNKDDDDLHDPATIKCIECDAYYCKVCIGAHKLVLQTKHHTHVPLKDINREHAMTYAQKKVSQCEIHPGFPLKYFCMDSACKIPVCPECIVVAHKNHQYTKLEPKAAEYRTQNAKVIDKDMQRAENDLQRLKKEIIKSKQNNVKQHKENETNIRERSKKMHRMIEEQEKLRLEEETKIHGELQYDYSKVETQVDEKLASLQETKNVLENMNNFSPDDEITRRYEDMKKETQKVITESKPPQFWVQSLSVAIRGDPVVDRKQNIIRGKEVKLQGLYINSITLLD